MRNLKKANMTEEATKLKVAAYCRVSTELEMQEGSLQTQIIHYTNYIRGKPEWDFIGVYSDRGKSGTNTKKRTGFNKLIKHAVEGKIDVILCKSISRFARNVQDTLENIRLLNENNVKVIFEREKLETNKAKSEFIITLLSAVAQEESRSISENLKWAFTKRFERGEGKFSRCLGYKLGEDKEWLIVEEEAEIVKEAFELFIKGRNPSQIAKLFIRKGYKTCKDRKYWYSGVIAAILANEKYIGDVICQKTFVKDYIGHKSVKNTGQRKKHLIKNHHKPIIDRKTFDLAQEILCKRAKQRERTKTKKKHLLSGRIHPFLLQYIG